MRLICFPCSLSQASLPFCRELAWLAMQIFPSPFSPPPFPLHCLQANVAMCLKNLVILMIVISSYCMRHSFFPPQPQVSLALNSLLFHSPTSHLSHLSSHCNRSHLALQVSFGPFLWNSLSSGTKSHFSCSIVTTLNIFELLLPFILLTQWSRETVV